MIEAIREDVIYEVKKRARVRFLLLVSECICVPAFCKISVNVNESLINN